MRKRVVLRWGMPGADCAGYFDARVCVRVCAGRRGNNRIK